MCWLKFEPVTIPQVVASTGSFVAIIAGLVGFLKLFKKDKEKGRQIASLAGIAEAQKDSLEQLKAQNVILTDGNKAQEKLLVKLAEILSNSQGMQKVNIDYQQQKRRNEIKPFFLFAGGGATRDEWDYSFVNQGKGLAMVKRADVMQIEENSTMFPIKEMQVGIAEKISIHGKHDKVNKTTNMPEFRIKLVFDDEDGNHYEQLMVNTMRERLPSAPVLVS
jgi:hypothetical protein